MMKRILLFLFGRYLRDLYVEQYCIDFNIDEVSRIIREASLSTIDNERLEKGLELLLKKDKENYFNSPIKSDQQLTIRGAYTRTLYLLNLIKKDGMKKKREKILEKVEFSNPRILD
jgi:hypothetical protein